MLEALIGRLWCSECLCFLRFHVFLAFGFVNVTRGLIETGIRLELRLRLWLWWWTVVILRFVFPVLLGCLSVLIVAVLLALRETAAAQDNDEDHDDDDETLWKNLVIDS